MKGGIVTSVAEQISAERLKQLRLQNTKTASEAYAIMCGHGVTPSLTQLCRALAMHAACARGLDPADKRPAALRYAQLIEDFALEEPAAVARNAKAASRPKLRKGRR